MLTRADLDTLPSYVPGRAIPGAVKLSSNEVPYGPLPGVVEAVARAVAESHRYPDMAVVTLRERLAQRLGVGADRVAVGCGSVALAEHLAAAACRDGDEILFAWRSFEAYPIIAATAGAAAVRVPNTAGHGHDLAAMAKAITDRTRLVFVCNPNNPTGTALSHDEVATFLDAVPPDVLVVLDEAYLEFVTDPDVTDGLAAFGDRPNVVVLRTLSKAWGLAGLRVGYLVASPEVAATVRKVVTPFSVSGVAQAAALAALDAEEEMRRRAQLVISERERVVEAVRALLPGAPESQANFVWLPLAGDRAAQFGAACEAGGVIVRPFAGDGVRVSIGTPEENDAFLALARAHLPGAAPTPGRRRRTSPATAEASSAGTARPARPAAARSSTPGPRRAPKPRG
jgi:histidinol-phosphate aminotransferase